MATANLPDSSYLSNITQNAYLRSGVSNQSDFFLDVEKQLKWEQIDSQFKEWLSHPLEEDEDGYVSPSIVSIKLASKFLDAFTTNSLPVPNWVVTNGDGGIVINFESTDHKMAIEFDESGTQELRIFVNHRLVERTQFDLIGEFT